MRPIDASDSMYVKDSKIVKGERGVFAKRDIKKGERIEQCPVIELSEQDPANEFGSQLVTYFFYVGENKQPVLSLGFGSLYNHSYDANAEYLYRNKMLEFVAIKNIKKGEEITINYNHGSLNDTTPLWFNS